ncbi:Solute carrier organic anion transporter family member 1A1, partial [Ophiophagus hannah]
MRYQYENTVSTSENVSSSMAVCLANQSDRFKSALLPSEECEEQEGSLMWVSVLIGNIIRGIGETPITPLGISYVEDFARAENSPFYIGCLQIATVLGPLFGLMIGSYCAQLYVDIGFINLEEVMINLTDTRWVGAWWLGVLVCAFANFLVAVPFCFLPKTLVKEGEENKTDVTAKRNKSLLKTENTGQAKIKLRELYKAGIPSPIYFGAMIDTTCLKWGTKTCGGTGACRMYDTDTYRKQAKDQTRQDLELEAKEEEREETDQKDMAVFQKCKDPQQETVGTTNADPQKV